MADVLYIGQWEAKPWYNTGGTRAKKYLQRPDGKYFYFKRSHFKAPTDGNLGKDYRYEFWSEIIAYEVGWHLGFEVLRYDIAVDKDVVGCISEDMILSDKEELIEGVKYLQGYDNAFNPADRAQHKAYTFQLIEEALRRYGLGEFMHEIIKMLVFDAIIGNGDRHQENWAIIHRFPPEMRALGKLERIFKEADERGIRIPNFLRKPVERLYDFKEGRLRPEFNDIKLGHTSRIRFAPLYDNGSSLGREIAPEKVPEYLNDNALLERYALRGKAEVHWQGEKLTHYDLMRELINTSYRDKVIEVIQTVQRLYDPTLILNIIKSIDEKLAHDYIEWMLPEQRKRLITKLITLRCEKLFALLP